MSVFTAAAVLVVAGMLWFGASAYAATATVTFAYTGSEQTFTVPAGVTSIHVVATGGAGGVATDGGTAGGRAAVVSGDLSVSPGPLYIEVGGPGGTTGGFNGGGSGYPALSGGGGGASDVRTVSDSATGSLASRLLVAAGGGGGGIAEEQFVPNCPGGAGGDEGQPGSDGENCGAGTAGYGGAGTSDGGGDGGAGVCTAVSLDATSGTLGEGGTDYIDIPLYGYVGNGGGGGGGLYGGGGGGGTCSDAGAGGGGGGSNLVPASGTASVDANGAPSSVTITFTAPPVSIGTSQQPASAAVGSSIADEATVSGGYDPTGTVTFDLYNNATASGTPLFTDTETLSGGTATSAGYTATALGTDYWVATYSGDGNNSGVTSATAGEPVTITKATPSIGTSQQPASAAVGSSIADKATVTGGYDPSGTVTFDLYNNSTASGTPLFTDTETLSGGTATSAGYTATAAGTDYWVATYNGDGNNSGVTSATAGEPVTITKATPSIGTSQQPASVTFGTAVADKATVTGGYNPTGTVTFDLYSNSNGTGTPLFTDTETLSGGSATSKSYTATTAGTDYWVATYNGNGNNSAVTSPTAGEPVTIARASTSLVASPQLILFEPFVGVGSQVVQATLTTGGTPLAGQTISFSDGSTPLCSAVTKANGVARCTISPFDQLLLNTNNHYTATFAGTIDYIGSSSTVAAVTLF
jgi:hypothetical protein